MTSTLRGGTILSLIDRLLIEFDELEKVILDLFDHSEIRYFNKQARSGTIMVAPEYFWDHLTDEGKYIQGQAINKYHNLFHYLELLFDKAPPDIKRDLDRLHTNMTVWIERNRMNFALPSNVNEAKGIISAEISKYKKLLIWFKKYSTSTNIFIPDSNAFIKNNQFETYGNSLGIKEYSIFFIPSVLEELDQLKTIHRDDNFRRKVMSRINQLKGYRSQGSLHEGIIIHKTITVKMIAVEPDFDNTLNWLSPSNMDDRIIASSFRIQVDNPSSIVILVTSDLNLQNKAEMAKLPFIETP